MKNTIYFIFSLELILNLSKTYPLFVMKNLFETGMNIKQKTRKNIVKDVSRICLYHTDAFTASSSHITQSPNSINIFAVEYDKFFIYFRKTRT